MAEKLVFVSGNKQLDAKLKLLPAKLQRKFGRKALRNAAKRVQKDYKRIVRQEAYDTGTMFRTSKILAKKKSKRRKGEVGVRIFIDRDKLFARYESKHGHPPHPATGQAEPFFYPAVIEFGDEHHEPVKPMRRALYENERAIKAYFEADINAMIREEQVRTQV